LPCVAFGLLYEPVDKQSKWEPARAGLPAASSASTLIELIVATAILIILTGMAVPLVRVTLQREREHELRRDLLDDADAIDRYKDAADRGAFQIKVGSEGYPPDLDTLVTGVDVQGKKLKFPLSRIPVEQVFAGHGISGVIGITDEAYPRAQY
jgi:general secretion pathway protein G